LIPVRCRGLLSVVYRQVRILGPWVTASCSVSGVLQTLLAHVPSSVDKPLTSTTSSPLLSCVICSWKCVRKSNNRHMLLGWFFSQCLKVHENRYLWATNKTVVPVTTVLEFNQRQFYFPGNTGAIIWHTSDSYIKKWWMKLALHTFVTLTTCRNILSNTYFTVQSQYLHTQYREPITTITT